MTIEFKRGEYITFEATTTIHLGRIERNISSGDLVEFDGFNLRIGGEEVSMPELKAGIKRGWLQTPSPASQLPTEPENNPRIEMDVELVYDEETKVASVDSALEAVQEAELSLEEKFPVQVSNEDADMISIAGIDNTSGAVVGGASSADDSLGLGEAQDAEAVPLKMKTATQQKTVLSDATSVAEQISELESLEGAFNADVLEYKEEVEEVAPILEDSLDDQMQEALDVLDAIEGDAPATGAVEITPKSDKVLTLPSGIEWDKSVHWTKRVKEAVETYGDQPEIIAEIKAVESDTIGEHIDKGLAQG